LFIHRDKSIRMRTIYPSTSESYNSIHRNELRRRAGNGTQTHMMRGPRGKMGYPMRALIERQLYHPAFVLPMVALMQLMVAFDFNVAQVSLVVATKSAQAGWHVIHHFAAHLLGYPVDQVCNRDRLCGCH
jgi:hypothetical protein